MATPPVFSNATALDASSLNAIGLWLVKTQTVGTGVTGVTVPDAFTTDFDTYRILYTGGTLSAGTDMSCFLGGTAPANGYYQGQVYVNITTAVTGNSTVNNQPQWTFVGGGSANGCFLDLTIYNPFQTRRKYVSYTGLTADIFYVNGTGRYDSTASFTSFTLRPSAGGVTMTGGTIYVYGHRR